jgi:hypothetical protein
LRKISVREPQGAWRQDELIYGKPPVDFDFEASQAREVSRELTAEF